MHHTAAARGRTGLTLDDRWVDDYVWIAVCFTTHGTTSMSRVLASALDRQDHFSSNLRLQMLETMLLVVQHFLYLRRLTAACN
jgi:hypothetical protein